MRHSRTVAAITPSSSRPSVRSILPTTAGSPAVMNVTPANSATRRSYISRANVTSRPTTPTIASTLTSRPAHSCRPKMRNDAATHQYNNGGLASHASPR